MLESADSEGAGNLNDQSRLFTTGKKTGLNKLYQSHNKTLDYQEVGIGLRNDGGCLRQSKIQPHDMDALEVADNRVAADQDVTAHSEGIQFNTAFSQGNRLPSAITQTPKNKCSSN